MTYREIDVDRVEIMRLLERLEPPPTPEWVAATTKGILSQFRDRATELPHDVG